MGRAGPSGSRGVACGGEPRSPFPLGMGSMSPNQDAANLARLPESRWRDVALCNGACTLMRKAVPGIASILHLYSTTPSLHVVPEVGVAQIDL